MAYFGGGPNPPKGWGARSDLRKLKREHAKLAERVAALEARNAQLEAKLASTTEALDTIGGAA